MTNINGIRVREILANSIITPSKLPDSDYVINPYVGCEHGCKYCYARFMKRFTGHEEEWGNFVDVKLNAAELIPSLLNAKYTGKSVTCASVSDPYQPLESKYRLTRNILEKLVISQPNLYVITKSSLIIRDIDVLKRFKACKVAISLSLLDDNIRKRLEPRADTITDRLTALEALRTAGLYTVLFVAPILPYLTDWRSIILRTKTFVNEYWFENLNMYPAIEENMHQFLMTINPKMVGIYSRIYLANNNYWESEEKAINIFCKEQNINCKFYFHHKATGKGFAKK